MKIRVALLALCFSFLLHPLPAQTNKTASPAASGETPKTSGIDAAKEADIRRLMSLVKVDSLITGMMDEMTTSIRPVLSNSLPPGDYRDKLIDLFFAKFKAKAEPKQIVDMAVPIYNKYFSDDEIKALIKFYETPVGQKAISAMPQLTSEMQQQGRAWGEKLGRDSMREVLAEHPDLADAMNAAITKGKMNQ